MEQATVYGQNLELPPIPTGSVVADVVIIARVVEPTQHGPEDSVILAQSPYCTPIVATGMIAAAGAIEHTAWANGAEDDEDDL